MEFRRPHLKPAAKDRVLPGLPLLQVSLGERPARHAIDVASHIEVHVLALRHHLAFVVLAGEGEDYSGFDLRVVTDEKDLARVRDKSVSERSRNALNGREAEFSFNHCWIAG